MNLQKLNPPILVKGVCSFMLTVILAILPAIPAWAEERNYLVAGYKNALPDPAAIAAAGGTWTDQIPSLGIALVKSSNSDFLTQIKKDKSVELAAPDVEMQSDEPEMNSLDAAIAEGATEGEPTQSETQSLGPAMLPNDPLAILQWDKMRLGVPQIHAKGCMGQGVTIALLDTGIKKNHLDLQGSVIDGISFVPTAPDPFPTQGNPNTVGHGTAAWGIIGAQRDNHIGVYGIAPEAKAVSVRISVDGSNIQMSTVLQAMGWILEVGKPLDGVDIILMDHSLKCFDTDPLCRENIIHLMGMGNRAIAEIYQQGMIFFSTAGNDSKNVSQDPSYKIWPAGHKGETISSTAPCCAACDHNVLNEAIEDYDHFTAYSNYGFLENYFVMPGGQGGGGPGQLPNNCNNYPTPSICTVAGINLPPNITCQQFDGIWTTSISGNSYLPFTGTSAAAPEAAGFAALVLSCNPDLKVGQLKDFIHGTAIDLGDPGYDLLFGFGLGNPIALLTAVP